jgi:hypothetical protein
MWIEEVNYLRALRKAGLMVKDKKGIYCAECSKYSNLIIRGKVKTWKMLDVCSEFRTTMKETINSYFNDAKKVEKGKNGTFVKLFSRILGL